MNASHSTEAHATDGATAPPQDTASLLAALAARRAAQPQPKPQPQPSAIDAAVAALPSFFGREQRKRYASLLVVGRTDDAEALRRRIIDAEAQRIARRDAVVTASQDAHDTTHAAARFREPPRPILVKLKTQIPDGKAQKPRNRGGYSVVAIGQDLRPSDVVATLLLLSYRRRITDALFFESCRRYARREPMRPYVAAMVAAALRPHSLSQSRTARRNRAASSSKLSLSFEGFDDAEAVHPSSFSVSRRGRSVAASDVSFCGILSPDAVLFHSITDGVPSFHLPVSVRGAHYFVRTLKRHARRYAHDESLAALGDSRAARRQQHRLTTAQHETAQRIAAFEASITLSRKHHHAALAARRAHVAPRPCDYRITDAVTLGIVGVFDAAAADRT